MHRAGWACRFVFWQECWRSGDSSGRQRQPSLWIKVNSRRFKCSGEQSCTHIKPSVLRWVVFRGTQLHVTSDFTKRRSFSSYNYFYLLGDRCTVSADLCLSMFYENVHFHEIALLKAIKLYLTHRLELCRTSRAFTSTYCVLHGRKIPGVEYYDVHLLHSTYLDFTITEEMLWMCCSVRGFMSADQQETSGTEQTVFHLFCKVINGNRDYDHWRKCTYNTVWPELPYWSISREQSKDVFVPIALRVMSK